EAAIEVGEFELERPAAGRLLALEEPLAPDVLEAGQARQRLDKRGIGQARPVLRLSTLVKAVILPVEVERRQQGQQLLLEQVRHGREHLGWLFKSRQSASCFLFQTLLQAANRRNWSIAVL